MKATILTIGDEILIGQIIDTNSAFIASALDAIGVEVHELLSVSDSREHILETFRRLQDEVDLVIITGGLGPTKDDITKKTFCDYFEDHLVVNDVVLAHVTQLIEGFYKRPINQMNKDQALVPSTCTVLENRHGTAPGMWMKKNSTVFISLPGVPYEMKGMISDVIIPKIIQEYSRPFIIHKTVMTYGMGESLLAEIIESWEDNLPQFIKLAYLPSPGRVRLRLSARGVDKEILEDALDSEIKKLYTFLGETIVGIDQGETIEKVVATLLSNQQKTLATAESVTGGKIAELLTANAGASKYFKGSIVAYSAEAKINALCVPKSVIDDYSVVSSEVAKSMARQIQNLLKSDYAIATTGNAGPTTDNTSATVGVVFIAIATPEGIICEEFNFGQPREKVIERTAIKALEMLQKEFLKNVK